MALVGFMRLGPVLLVILPALSLACLVPAPDQALVWFNLDYGTVLNQTQADLEQCQAACCNQTRCDVVQVNVNQEGAGPKCTLIHCSQNCLRPKDQKQDQKQDQDQVQIYHKISITKQKGRLSLLMIPPVPENQETTGSDADHGGTEGEPEGSPAHNETDTETGETKTDTETGDVDTTETGETKTIRDEDQPAPSDQDRSACCRLPKKVGSCRAALPRFFYNLTSQSCSVFTYGGCGGNANNFDTQQDCESTCGGVTEVLLNDSSPGSRQINAEVLPSKGVVKPADAPSDSSDMTAMCFAPPDVGRCRGYFPMFYYDPNTNTCDEFIYGGCRGNKNRYSSLEECMNTCSGGGLFGARGQRRNWTAGVFLFVALAAISALLLGALIAITLRRNRLPHRPPSSISDKEELLHDDTSSLDSVGIPPSPGQSQA